MGDSTKTRRRGGIGDLLPEEREFKAAKKNKSAMRCFMVCKRFPEEYVRSLSGRGERKKGSHRIQTLT